MNVEKLFTHFELNAFVYLLYACLSFDIIRALQPKKVNNGHYRLILSYNKNVTIINIKL